MPDHNLADVLSWLVPGLLAFLCSHVTLECRARMAESLAAQDADRWHWLAGAALGLGTGVWALHINSMWLEPMAAGIHYQPGPLTLGWLAGVMLSGLAIWLSLVVRPVFLAWMLGAALAGAVAVVSCLMNLLAADLLGVIRWQPGPMVTAALALPTLGGLALALRHLQPGGLAGHAIRLAATLLLAAGLWLSETQMVAARVLQGLPDVSDTGLGLTALALLARLGTLVLLLMTLVLSRREAQARASISQARNEVERESLTDPLTRLPNRQAFEQHLKDQALQGERNGTGLALLFIDLDGFKPINESFGHQSGDWMLNAVGQRLRATTQEREFVARWGADQFLLLMPGTRTRDSLASRAREVLAAVCLPLDVLGRELPVQASIGLALCPEDGGASTLVAHADAATHAAKSAGGGTFCFFEPHMLHDSREQMELLRDLRKAIEERELELYYQPKIHAPSGQITGAEALIRWNHPSKGLISPGAFIPVAERFGLIGAVGDWVINQACRQIHEWREGGLRMRVAINLSVHQLRQDDLAQRIDAALKRHDVNPTLLTCEITESVAMENNATSKAFFDKLEAVGVHISIDDFGTGYSSLSYLRQLPAEELKIDAAFVKDLEFSNDARAVVDAVVKLGLALGLKVVAEGVETEVQRDILRQLGCNELQGFLFAKPMAANRLFLWAMSDDGPSHIDFRQSLFGDTQLPEDLLGGEPARP